MTATATTVDNSSQVAMRLTATGRVQGIGLRPAVAKLGEIESRQGSVDQRSSEQPGPKLKVFGHCQH